jgi:ATP-dependent exoDNAse (exonuclease V) beta subunit
MNATIEIPLQGQRLPNRLIRASAGTGKTFQLSNRFLQLILAGHSADRILASTFTRKAAGEILQRIVYRLALASVDQAAADRLAREVERSELKVEDCRRALKNLTRNLHRLRVSTLDAFFVQAAQTLSLELGLPPGWRIVDEIEAEAIREEALVDLLMHQQPHDVMRLVHWLAKGETIRGVHRLLSDTVKSMYDLFLDAPRDAWHQLKPMRELPVSQWEDLLFRLEGLAIEEVSGKQLGGALSKMLWAARDEVWPEVLKGALVTNINAGDLRFSRKTLPDAVVEVVKLVIEQARANVVNQLVQQTQASLELLERYHLHYQSLKLQRRALRFDDLPRYLTRLHDASHLQRLAYRLDASIDSLLLDEFQDTSLQQWRVLQFLARHAAEPVRDRSFFCVGDVKQAIYGWRGGNAELLHAVAREIPDTEDRRLDCSFRSSRPVIETVNEINRHFTNHSDLDRAQKAVERWCDAFPVHDTKRDDLPGYVTLETHSAGSDRDEEQTNAIALTVERVAHLRTRAPHLSIAVLVRTNKMVGQVIFELQRRQIAASEEGGNPLTDAASVQLVMSLLQLIDHPTDSAARYHLASSPWAPQLGLDASADEAAAVDLAHRFRMLLATDGYGATVAAWAEQLRPFANARESRRLGQLTELAYEYQQSIETPRTIGFQHQQREPLRTAGLLRRIAEKKIKDPTEDPVRVMNVHQSKGLQFDVVLLPDLESDLGDRVTPSFVASRPEATSPIQQIIRYVPREILPLLPAWVEQVHEGHYEDRVAEELCVLYVALTRAVHAMHMIIAPSNYLPGRDDEKVTKKKKADSVPRSVAGLLRAALCGCDPVEPDKVLYACGDPDWLSKLPRIDFKPVVDRLQPSPKVELAASDATMAHRADFSINPSELEGGGRVSLRQQLSFPNRTAMQFGSLVHAFFEQIEWLDRDPPSEASLRAIGLARDADPQHLEVALAAFYQQLKQPRVSAVLSRSYYKAWLNRIASKQPGAVELMVKREQRLASREAEGFMVGYIDRLVLFCRNQRPIAADVVDFKTDQVGNAEELQQRVAHYRPQLLAYVRGIARMLQLPGKAVTARLVFLQADQAIEIDP